MESATAITAAFVPLLQWNSGLESRTEAFHTFGTHRKLSDTVMMSRSGPSPMYVCTFAALPFAGALWGSRHI